MRNELDTLLRAAEAVSQRVSIDWEQESGGDANLRRKLAHLQVVDAIAESNEVPPELDSGTQTTADGELSPDLPFRNWGNLRLLENIGGGAFGEVYRAYDSALQREVALKLLIPGPAWGSGQARQFKDEARKLARVRHPNVLAVHGVDEHQGRLGIWTDLLPGRDLEALLTLQGPMGPEEATVVGLTLCRALAAVHSAGLVHRDVKTSNIMREQGGRIVLMDFGTVTELGAESPEEGKISGTPLFMAPEVLGGQPGGVTADVYSLGVVLYRLVTGKFPIEAHTLREVRRKHREGESRTLLDARPDLPTRYVNVVNRCLAPDPSQRFSSMGAVEQALSSVRVGPSPVPAPRVWSRLLPAAALVAVLAVALWILFGSDPLQVDVSLFRAGGEADARLLPGATVQMGDELFLELECSGATYVYVFEEDEAGRAYVLFPLPGEELQNPVGAGAHRLPGTANWQVSSVGGSETLYLVASRKRLEGLEERLAEIPKAGDGTAYEADSLTLAQSLRGIGGITTPEHVESTSARHLSALFDDIEQEQWAQIGIHVWQMVLSNPG